MPDPDIIERAERLLAEATPGPWHWNSYSRIGAPVPFGHPLNMADDDEPSFAGVCWVDGGPQQDGHGDDLIVPEAKANARLIAAAPALLADLLEEVKRLRAERIGEIWSCSYCGPHPRSTSMWCESGCGRDYNQMTRLALVKW